MPSQLSFQQCFLPGRKTGLTPDWCVGLGLLETFYVLGADTKKDANIKATCLAAVLDQCQIAVESLGPDYSLPRHLIVAADNTPREAKNQFFATFVALLVASNQFDTVEVQYLQVGHTNNELDQRVSSLATILSKARVKLARDLKHDLGTQ